jgi:hypothetical protein
VHSSVGFRVVVPCVHAALTMQPLMQASDTLLLAHPAQVLPVIYDLCEYFFYIMRV